MAAASGIQAVLYLQSFGTGQRTDAFFAAFSLYAVFGVFAQSIRVTSVPLLVGENRRMRGRDFAATLGVIAIPVIVACGPLAGQLAQALAPGVSDSARHVTVDGLRLLGGAMVLQLAAAGGATLLAVWDRFDVVFGAYVGGAVSGLAAFLIARPLAGELTLGWSMLAMGAVTCGWILVGVQRARTVRRPGRVASPGRLVTNAGLILARTLVAFVFNGLYLVTLAVASRSAHGDATVLSYAYLYVSYLVAGTSVSVAISRVTDMTRGVQENWRDVVADTVPHGFRYAALVSLPAVAALVACGATIIGKLFPHSLPPHQVATLQTLAALLVPWMIAALLVNFLLPALFALGRASLVNLLALPMVAVQLGATLAGNALFGIDGTVGAFFIAPLLYGVALLGFAGGRDALRVLGEVMRDAVTFSALAAGAFGLGALLYLPLGRGLAGAIVVGLAGSGLYLAAGRVLAPKQFAVLAGLRRMSSRGKAA
jgi:peptidoglycan biosynthesis protein MviN/MurJ (putative lipid II flippase)